MKLLYSLLILSIFIISHINAYGESSDGYPNSNERETLILINMVRMFPLEFKRDYLVPLNQTGIDNVFKNNVYPPVKPLRSDNSLNIAARAHSQDMANNRCFVHNSCNGESFSDRLERFKACGSGYWGENISAGNRSPMGSMSAFICDAGANGCVLDGASGDGHRANIMNGGYKSVGVGYVSKPDGVYPTYYTQDFGGSVCDDTNDSPIYSAYYTMVNNSPRFVAVYSNNTYPLKSVTLNFNNTDYTMNLKYGNSSFGVLIKDNIEFEFCSPFYFTAENSNGTVRYPTEGFLRVATNSSCPSWSEDFEYSSASTLALSITLFISLILSLLFI